jgi:hypothetical protein
VLEVLTNSPSLQEVLWNFSRFKDEKQRLTLGDNPHFYSELPTSLDAYTDSLEINPTDDFWRADEFYVLTDKPEPLYIVTDWGAQTFGNFWCPQNAIIFKGFGVLFFFNSSLFLMSCQTSMGGFGERASSGHLSEALTMGSVSGSRCRPFQELPGIADYSRLSLRDTHG